MEVVIAKSKKLDKNTMPGLMVLKLLALVRKGLQTSQNIKTYIRY